MQGTSPHRLGDERREAGLATGVAQRAVELIRIHRFGRASLAAQVAASLEQSDAMLSDRGQAMLPIDLVDLLHERRSERLAQAGLLAVVGDVSFECCLVGIGPSLAPFDVRLDGVGDIRRRERLNVGGLEVLQKRFPLASELGKECIVIVESDDEHDHATLNGEGVRIWKNQIEVSVIDLGQFGLAHVSVEQCERAFQQERVFHAKLPQRRPTCPDLSAVRI